MSLGAKQKKMPDSLGYDVVISPTGEQSTPILASAPGIDELNAIGSLLGRKLSFEQLAVVVEILGNMDNGMHVFLVEGSAGVGKSTMIRAIQEAKGDAVQVSFFGSIQNHTPSSFRKEVNYRF